LHKYNYTFFTINNLTFAEANLLIKAFNEEQKDIERARKKNTK